MVRFDDVTVMTNLWLSDLCFELVETNFQYAIRPDGWL